MDGGNSARPPSSSGEGVFNDDSNNASNNSNNNGGTNSNNGSGRGGARRLTNIEQQLLAEDNAAASGGGGGGPAGFYRGNGLAGMGMYGAPGVNDPNARQQQLNSIYGAAGLQAGLPSMTRGLLPGQFDDQGFAGLQQGMGGGLNMNQLRPLQQQQQQLQQQPSDFQGLMPTGFDGSGADASALLGNPAAMAGYPMFNPAAAGLGVDAAAAPGLLNPNAGLGGGAPGVARGAGPHSLFDQGYNFARSEMALVRHQAAFNNNLMAAGAGGQLGLAALDRQNAAALSRGLGPPGYPNYGADPMNMGAPIGADPYRGMANNEGPKAGHLATIPAIRLAQHRSALQRRMMANSLPERKDGSFPVVLYQESDEHKLTAYQCLLRKQLELFEADEDDVRCSTRQGRTAPIKLGQVGLRCRHCAGVQLAARTKGAAYYSQTVEGIYQIAQNMSKVHLCERCYRIPRDVRRQLIVLRSDCRRAIGGKEYWSENIRALGVYVDEGILRVKKAAPKENQSPPDVKKGETTMEEDETNKMETTTKEQHDAAEKDTTDDKMDVKVENDDDKAETATEKKDESGGDGEAEKPADGEADKEKPSEEAAPMDEDDDKTDGKKEEESSSSDAPNDASKDTEDKTEKDKIDDDEPEPSIPEEDKTEKDTSTEDEKKEEDKKAEDDKDTMEVEEGDKREESKVKEAEKPEETETDKTADEEPKASDEGGKDEEDIVL